eukprot:1021729-Prymnesium_polylepis.1
MPSCAADTKAYGPRTPFVLWIATATGPHETRPLWASLTQPGHSQSDRFTSHTDPNGSSTAVTHLPGLQRASNALPISVELICQDCLSKPMKLPAASRPAPASSGVETCGGACDRIARASVSVTEAVSRQGACTHRLRNGTVASNKISRCRVRVVDRHRQCCGSHGGSLALQRLAIRVLHGVSLCLAKFVTLSREVSIHERSDSPNQGSE